MSERPLVAGVVVPVLPPVSARSMFSGSSPVTVINQWAQRRDGLGHGGVPMARGNATRQASNAARGTY